MPKNEPLAQTFPPPQADVILQTPQVTVENPASRLWTPFPTTILRSNERFFTLNIENDKFGSGYDRDYTNGLRLTWFNVGADQPFYVDWIDRLVPTFEVNKTTSSYFSFGHNLYTPSDIDRATLDTRDRPYAAFVYGSAGVSTITDRHMDDTELTLGWIGPSAQGEFIQDKFHRLIHADYQPHGWKHQLRDEPAVMLSWERSWPAYYTADIGKKTAHPLRAARRTDPWQRLHLRQRGLHHRPHPCQPALANPAGARPPRHSRQRLLRIHRRPRLDGLPRLRRPPDGAQHLPRR